MDKYKDKINFSKLEILCMVVLVACFVLGGVAIVTLATNNQKTINLKQEANSIIEAAKIAYNNYSHLNNTEYIVTSNNGESKGMCITLDGLVNNDFTTKTYDNWDGYVVVEEKNNNFFYSIWLTDKEYVIAGYEASKIDDLKLNKGITKFDQEEFAHSVRKEFASTSTDKGGTGNKYSSKCLSEKIE